MGTSNINDIKNDVKAKEIIPKLSDSQLFGRLMYVSFSKSIRLKFRGLFFKRLEEIQHCSFASKRAHQHKTRTSK